MGRGGNRLGALGMGPCAARRRAGGGGGRVEPRGAATWKGRKPKSTGNLRWAIAGLTTESDQDIIVPPPESVSWQLARIGRSADEARGK